MQARNILIIGDNPKEQMALFEKDKQVEPYIKYHYSDASKLRAKSLEFYNAFLAKKDELNFNEYQIKTLKDKIKRLSEMSDDDYFKILGEGCEINSKGDIIDTTNPLGKWSSYSQVEMGSVMPLILKDGTKAYSALKSEIDLEKTSRQESEKYERTWALVIDNEEPSNKTDEIILSNMLPHKEYIASFKCKEEYVSYCSSFWCYAVLNNNKWQDIDDNDIFNSSSEWINGFFSVFIDSLSLDERVSIYKFR